MKYIKNRGKQNALITQCRMQCHKQADNMRKKTLPRIILWICNSSLMLNGWLLYICRPVATLTVGMFQIKTQQNPAQAMLSPSELQIDRWTGHRSTDLWYVGCFNIPYAHALTKWKTFILSGRRPQNNTQWQFDWPIRQPEIYVQFELK